MSTASIRVRRWQIKKQQEGKCRNCGKEIGDEGCSRCRRCRKVKNLSRRLRRRKGSIE